MPGGYVHQACAERACMVAGITPVNMAALRMGAQGPDPLFLLGMFPLRPSSRPSKLAKALHTRRTGMFLCTLLQGAKDGNAAQRAYAMGFLTHYAVDCAVHPYVYSMSYDTKGRYSSALHMGLERAWDTMLWRAQGHKGTPLSMPCLCEARGDWPDVARLLESAVNTVFPEMQIKQEAILHAFSDTCRANRLTHSPLGGKYAVYWLLERVAFMPGMLTAQCCPPRPSRGDVLNREGRPWRAAAAPQQERKETVEELWASGVRHAAKLLRAAASYFDGELDEVALAKEIGDQAMDTGAKSRP